MKKTDFFTHLEMRDSNGTGSDQGKVSKGDMGHFQMEGG